MSIFIWPAISHFREPKHGFDVPELVFHFGPHAQLVPVARALFISQLSVAAALRLGEFLGPPRMVGDSLCLPALRGVVPESGFLAVEQIGQCLGILDIGGFYDDGMDQLCATLDTDVRFHAEVPLVALTGLAHLRFGLFVFVRGGTRCADNTCVDNTAPGYLQAVFLQILSHQVEQLISQIVLLHKVVELAYRGFARHRLPAEVDTYEVARRTRLVESFLGSRIVQREPVLDKVYLQLTLDTDRASCALWLGVERLDSSAQLLPENDGFYLLKQLLFERLLPVFLEPGSGQGVVAHEVQRVLETGAMINEHRD